MIIIFSVIFSIISIIISYQFKKYNEHLLFLKLTGYYILSVVTITFNASIPIPVGFLAAFILTDRSNFNKFSKRLCILLGLFDSLICAILFYIFIL